jgi:hypothetical protein
MNILGNYLSIAHAIDTKKMDITRTQLQESIVKACKNDNITESDKIEVQLLLSHYRMRLLQYMLGVAVPMRILSRMLPENTKRRTKKRFPQSSRVTELNGGGKMRGGVNAKHVLASIFASLFFVNVGNSVVDRGSLDNDANKFAKYVDLMGEQQDVPDKYTLFTKDPSDAARGVVKSTHAPPEIIHFSTDSKIDLLRAALHEYNAKIDATVDAADIRPFLKLELGDDNSLPVLLPLETIGKSLEALKSAHEDWLKSSANLVNYIPSLETVTTEWAPAIAVTAVSYYAGSTSWDDKMTIFQGISDLTKTTTSALAKAAPQVGDVALKVSKVALKNPQAAAGVAVFGAQVAVDLGNNYVVKPTAKAIKYVDDAYDGAMSTITGHQEGPINAVIEMQNKLNEIDAIISKLSVSTKAAVLDGKKTESVKLFTSPNIEEVMKWANWKSEGTVIIAAIKNFFGLSAYLARGTAEFGAEAIKIEFKVGSKHFFENVATLWSILVYIASTSFYSNCVTGALIYSLFRLYSSNKKGVNKKPNIRLEEDEYEEDAPRNTRRKTNAKKRSTLKRRNESESPPPSIDEQEYYPTVDEPVPIEMHTRRSTRRVVHVPAPSTTGVKRNTRSRAADEPERIAEGQQYTEKQRDLMRKSMSKYPNIKKATEVIEKIKKGDYSDFENTSNKNNTRSNRSRSSSRHSNRSKEEGEISDKERSPSSSPYNPGD